MNSESINELAVALIVAQSQIAPAEKDAKGNFGTYTTLRSVWDACKKALHENGFAVLQFAEPSESGTLALTTLLLHSSGQWISGTERAPLQKNDPQGYGSAMTYLRRYGLAAMVGVCPEDDDGAQASQGGARNAPRARTQSPAAQQPQRPPAAPQGGYGAMTPSTASDIARRWFYAKVKEDHGLSGPEAYALLGVKSLSEEMPTATFDTILQWIGTARLQAQKKAASGN